MNALPPIFDTVFYGLLYVIPIILAIGGIKILFGARIKGAAGERAVSNALKGMGTELLNDVIIPDGRGGLTQLDHVVLTSDRLLVLETKNYKGMIFGQEWDKQWTQKLGRRSYQFENPLHQNYLHTEALKALLPGRRVQGLVVFVGGGIFPKGMPNGVTTLLGLEKNIEYLTEGSGIDAKLWDAWDQLKSEARTDRSARREHLASISMKHGKSMAAPTGVGLLMASVIGIVAVGVFYFRDKPAKEAIKAPSSQKAYPVYKTITSTQGQLVNETISSKPAKHPNPTRPKTDSNEWRCNYWRDQYRIDKRDHIRVAMEENCSPVLLKWEN